MIEWIDEWIIIEWNGMNESNHYGMEWNRSNGMMNESNQ